jgi:hypothetical protein
MHDEFTLKQSLSLRHLTSSVKRPWQLLDIFSAVKISHLLWKYVMIHSNLRLICPFMVLNGSKIGGVADMDKRGHLVYFRASAGIS